MKSSYKKPQSKKKSPNKKGGQMETTISTSNAPKELSLYQQIKQACNKRFRSKSTASQRYLELALKYIMSIKPNEPQIKFNFDLIQKSEAKTFGLILVDFKFLESITFWSDIISVTALEKRNALVELPLRVRMEWEKTKLSQNTFENIWFIKHFAEHIRHSLKL